MRLTRLSVYVLSLAAVIAAASSSEAADKGKKGKNKADKAAAAVQDNVLVADLRAAYAVIDRADPIYQGHRAKARHEINHAIEQLEKEMKLRGLKAHHRPSEKETRAESDALIAQGMKAVATTQSQLGNLPTSKRRATAQAHLAKAVEELKSCLAVSKEKALKDKE
jgi:hypothetical protein